MGRVEGELLWFIVLLKLSPSLVCLSVFTFSQIQNSVFSPPTGPLKYFTRLEGFTPSPLFVFVCLCVFACCNVPKLYEVQRDGNTKTDPHHSEKFNYGLLAGMYKQRGGRPEGRAVREKQEEPQRRKCVYVCAQSAGFFLLVGQRSNIRGQGWLRSDSSLADIFMSTERGILAICFKEHWIRWRSSFWKHFFSGVKVTFVQHLSFFLHLVLAAEYFCAAETLHSSFHSAEVINLQIVDAFLCVFIRNSDCLSHFSPKVAAAAKLIMMPSSCFTALAFLEFPPI